MSFDSFFAKFERIFMGPMTKLAQQRHLLAVRDGMISTIPLTIVGSVFLIIAFLPVPQAWNESIAFFKFLKTHALTIMIPFRVTMGLVAIYATYTIGYSLAKSYELDGKSGGSLALMAFFMTTLPQAAYSVMNAMKSVTLADGSDVMVLTADQLTALGLVIPMDRLGGAGLFVGIFTAIVAVEILRFFEKNNLVIRMPDGVPDSVARSFSALFPAFAVMIVMFGFLVIARIWPILDLHTIFSAVFSPLKKVVDTPVGAVLIVLFITMLWAAGIHGVSIIGTIVRPVWLDMLDQNAQAHAEMLQFGTTNITSYITPEPFFQWFIWIGGSGGTIGLVLWLLVARSRYLKELGKVTFLPSIFNINEPLIFGLPIMLNPFFFVPFILGPVIVTIFTYVVMSLGWVNAPFALAPWTLPGPIGAYIATGDWRAIILNIVNIIILAVIYYPFMRAYDTKMLKEEQGEAVA
ncbi:PTS transporter subunit EIIC [Entomospira nematocerorum]|uniref:Permease IIC component n=1 Tax=Entomospira nematocerorum TaxID=2719987 RepID=A0A968KY35_9SPIO|nr:PTS transporter subunit EIIC [Entomospira nematocera]NIZ47162.1 PTS sugar transporter subunit IIC [Entomospira nematocera]WDI34295.1 PTS transporter subunit EIIC [Entomospira nematocera]